MQQLTLQFEGYADTRQPETPGTARKCSKKFKACDLSIGWALKQCDPVAAVQQVINNVKAWGRGHREQLECYVGGPLIVAFCAALCYLASVLEGGAL